MLKISNNIFSNFKLVTRKMASAALVISAVLFICTFGIHSIILNDDRIRSKPMYTKHPVMSVIPWISGFILPVITWTQITEYHWLVLFIVNFAVVLFIGPWLTTGFLARFASGIGLGKDMFTAFIAGIVALTIGLFFK